MESYGIHFDGVVYGPFSTDEEAKAWASRQVLMADAGEVSALTGHEWAVVRIVSPKWHEN